MNRQITGPGNSKIVIPISYKFRRGAFYRSKQFVKFVVLILLAVTGCPAVAAIGGNGGVRDQVSCVPPRMFANGIRVTHDGSVLIQVALRCVDVNPQTGNWRGPSRFTPRSRTGRLQGTSDLTTQTFRCPQNTYIDGEIRGFTGNVLAATVVSGLRVRCVGFTNINAQENRATVTFEPFQRIGARFTGTEFRIGLPAQENIGNRALRTLRIRRGLALDQVEINTSTGDLRTMPWITFESPTVRVSPGTGPVTPPPQPPPSPPARPDLHPRLISGLWRYDGKNDGQVTFRKARYRRVAQSFCSTGMQGKGINSPRTKQFDLPALVYEVTNSGNGASAAYVVRQQFDAGVQDINLEPLDAGARSRRVNIDRANNIRRCVAIGGGLPAGCYECSGSIRYEDPPLVLHVDPANNVAESNETNNRLQR